MTFSVASLIAELREHRLLEGASEAGIAALQDRFQDPRSLAKELMERGWLTPFQVNQVFQGRAADLLLGSYVLQERIGEGGMGQVFKARNWKLGNVVALKVIRKERLSNPNIIRRFYREMEAAGKLDHANIVRAFDADQVGDNHFFAMEYIEGTDLTKLVRKLGPLPVATACDMIRQAALGLEHAMERGLTHRDIKPANLLVSGGVVRILDMGLALLQLENSESDSTLTHEGAVMGTPDYIAPEQSLDSHNVDIRADIYSLGCTLYFLLTAAVPFPGGTMTEKLLRHQDEEPPPVETLRPEVSGQLSALVRKLLAKSPDDRYQTPAELAQALNELVTSGRCMAVDVPKIPSANPFARLEGEAETATATVQPVVGRSRWWIGGGAVATLLLVALLAWLVPSANWGPKVDAEVPAITVRVEAQRPWQDSGIDVEAGVPLTVSVRGQWEKKGWGQVPAWGVDGVSRDRTILQDAAPMCLLGRVGNQEPVPLGKLRTWTPSESGRLFLQANHLELEETAGSVKVEIKGGKAGTVAMASPALARVQMAEAILPKLQARADQRSDDPKSLRHDLVEFSLKYWGTLQAAKAASLLIPLASPLDSLNPADIPAGELATAGKGDASLAPAGLAAILGDSKKQHNAVRPVAVCFDGSRIASAGDDHHVRIWDAAAGKRLFLLKGHSDKISSLAFSLDGTWLASASFDRTVKVWDVHTGKELASFDSDGKEPAVAFNPSGKRLAATAISKSIPPRHVEAQAGSFALEWHLGDYSSLAFSPDGKRLALAGPQRLIIKDVETDKRILTLAADPIHGVAFSPDGKRLASAGPDKSVKVWAAATGKELHHLSGHRDTVRAVAFRPDGRLLASAGDDGKVILWDIAAGKVLREWFHPWGPVHGIAFAGDGRHLITGNDSGTVYVIRLGPPALVPTPWQPIAKSPLDSLRPDRIPDFEITEKPNDLVAVLGDSRFKHWGQAYQVAFRPGRRELASASLDQTVRIWDPANGRLLKRILAHPGGAYRVAYSPDGKFLATGGADSLAKIWDADSGREIHSLKGHSNFVYGLAFSKDGKRLASTSYDLTVKIWNVDTGKELSTLKGHKRVIWGAVFHPIHNRLATCSDQEIKVWDLDKGTAVVSKPGPFTSIAYSEDGTRLATGSGNGFVTISDDMGEKEIKQWSPLSGGVYGLAFGKDGRHVFTGGTGIVKKWDSITGQEVMAFPRLPFHVHGLALSHDGKLLAAAIKDVGVVKVWDADRGSEIHSTKGHAGAVRSVAVTPDGKWIASAADDQRVILWDAAGGREHLAVAVDEPYIAKLTLSPEGRRLAVLGPTRSVKILDISGRELFTLTGHSQPIWSIAFSPDGSRVISGGDNKEIKVWDAATGQLLLALDQASTVTAVAFSPDGKEFAAADNSSPADAATVRLYDAATGKVLYSMAHGGPVTCLGYHRDGRLASGGPHRQVKVWRGGKELLAVTCPGQVEGIAFSPDGALLATADSKGLVLWHADTGEKRRQWPFPGPIRSVAFAPDGWHVLAGTDLGVIYVFRLPADFGKK